MGLIVLLLLGILLTMLGMGWLVLAVLVVGVPLVFLTAAFSERTPTPLCPPLTPEQTRRRDRYDYTMLAVVGAALVAAVASMVWVT